MQAGAIWRRLYSPSLMTPQPVYQHVPNSTDRLRRISVIAFFATALAMLMGVLELQYLRGVDAEVVGGREVCARNVGRKGTVVLEYSDCADDQLERSRLAGRRAGEVDLEIDIGPKSIRKSVYLDWEDYNRALEKRSIFIARMGSTGQNVIPMDAWYFASPITWAWRTFAPAFALPAAVLIGVGLMMAAVRPFWLRVSSWWKGLGDNGEA